MKDLRRKLIQLDNLKPNNGGCGIIALALYRYLRKDCSLFLVDYYNSHTMKEIKDNNASNKPFKVPLHMSLFIENNIIDTYGIKHIDDYHNRNVDFVIVPFNERSLLETINNKGWNRRFNREEKIPIIEKTLNVKLNDVLLL